MQKNRVEIKYKQGINSQYTKYKYLQKGEKTRILQIESVYKATQISVLAVQRKKAKKVHKYSTIGQ